jgi:DNA-3-methyladenine glycosylase
MSPEALREVLREQTVEQSARMLLGARLHVLGIEVQIVETEAYHGESDPGSHAWRGPTPRTQIMYGEPGFAYIYFTYGNHWMLNVTCRPVGEAGAVLIRAAMPLHGLELMRERRPKARTDRDLLSGPGKLAAALGLNSAQHGADLLAPDSPIQLVIGEPTKEVWQGVRVGLAPHRGAETPWRFIDLKRADWSSRPQPRQP